MHSSPQGLLSPSQPNNDLGPNFLSLDTWGLWNLATWNLTNLDHQDRDHYQIVGIQFLMMTLLLMVVAEKLARSVCLRAEF